MEEANLLLAALSGFVGAIILTTLIYLLKNANYNVDIPYLLGTMFADIKDKQTVYIIGVILHLLIGAFWGVLYVILLTASHIPPNWPAGILWGFAHGIFVGVIMGNLTQNHPYVGEGKPIPDPGILGSGWGDLVPYWILGLHVIFGVVTLTTYNLLV